MNATTDPAEPLNVGARLTAVAMRMPEAVAVAEPLGRDRQGKRQYRQMVFAQLDADSSHIAEGILSLGAAPGDRLALLVRPGVDFISLVFAMLKAGVVMILIDPGIGRRNLVRCLAEAEPKGFIAIPAAQAIRTLLRRRFPNSRVHVTAGRRWFWGGATLAELRRRPPRDFTPPATTADDPAAIIFTSGSTGAPKGVLYTHGNFSRQVDEIRDHYGIEPGAVDLPGFPLFALFNAVMGVTTIIPDMDFTRPARVSPEKFLEAARDWSVTQSFGSPALWNTVGRYCESRGEKMPTLRRAFSAGAPVPPHLLLRVKNAMHPEGDVFTPYGATEALPVASISATEVLGETSQLSQLGRGTCVGSRFPGIEWKVIAISDEPIATLSQATELPRGEIGELAVSGAVVTREYVTRREANAFHKMLDGGAVWHRMGDVGYLDEQDRFWFCGRKSHRVRTESGTLYTIPCEAIFNNHSHVYRSALVGVGAAPRQRPVIIVEPWPEHWPHDTAAKQRLIDELRHIAQAHELTRSIHDILLHRSLPVDIRHNAKIFREKLAVWAVKKL